MYPATYPAIPSGPIRLSNDVSTYLPIDLSIYLVCCLPVYLSVCLSACLSVCPCLSGLVLSCLVWSGLVCLSHRVSKKWWSPLVFRTFWLRNALRATTECTFSTSELPKVVWDPHVVLNILTWKCASRHALRVVRTWCVLYILIWKFALRNNSVQFLFLLWPDGSAPAALASLLFHPPHLEIIRKTQCFATFLTFHEPVSSFFWLFLPSTLLYSTLLSSTLLYSTLLSSTLLSSTLLSSTALFSLTLPICAFYLSITAKLPLTTWKVDGATPMYWFMAPIF